MYQDDMHYSHYIYCTDTINVTTSQVSQVAVIRIVSTRQRCQYDWLGSIGVDGVQVAIEHGVAQHPVAALEGGGVGSRALESCGRRDSWSCGMDRRQISRVNAPESRL